jgi:hypothetical protein
MQKLRLRATTTILHVDIDFSSAFSCDLASTFNVLTYMVATYHVAGIILASKSYVIGLQSHSTCRWR